MYKIGTFLIWWVGYFPDQTFYRGKDLLYEDNMLFHGPFVDNLGSVLILRGSGIILLENSHKNLNCTNAKNNSRKRIECSLKSTMKQ